ncbi:hypothetical protein ACFQ51_41985 [Streptomyces kaempferi]
MSDQLLTHPLAALRAALGLSGEQYLDRLDEVHFALGYGRMAKSRQKVSRWENGVNCPEMPARYAMARLHGIPREAVAEVGWPGFLLLAFADDRPVLDSPWTLAGTVTAVGAAARGGSMQDRRGFLIASGATLTGLATNWNLALAAQAEASPVLPPGTAPAAPASRLPCWTRWNSAWTTCAGLTTLSAAPGCARQLSPSTNSSRAWPSRPDSTGLSNTACCPCSPSPPACAGGSSSTQVTTPALSARYYVTALRASASRGDHQTGANTLAFMAIQVYSEGNPHDAVGLVRTAQDATARRTTPVCGRCSTPAPPAHCPRPVTGPPAGENWTPRGPSTPAARTTTTRHGRPGSTRARSKCSPDHPPSTWTIHVVP